MPSELKINVKIFADGTSLFAIVKDKNKSDNTINDDLKLISKRAYNWKMLINPDPSKPTQELLFPRKNQVQIHPAISLSNIQVKLAPYQKHLGLILDEKPNFKQHIVCAI